jgi:hypothetical protein
MNQNTLKNVIIGLLIVIIFLLVILYLHRSRPQPTVAATKPTTYPTIVKSAPPVILDSPYLYDSGYWLDPDLWWGGNGGETTYVNNYYYNQNNHNNHNKPTTTHAMTPSTTSAIPGPTITLAHEPTLGLAPPTGLPEPTNGIQSILPTGQLIAPSQDSIFPLPTLASIPEQIPIPSIEAPPQIQPPVEMTHQRLPALVNNGSGSHRQMIPDSQAAKVDVMASQMLGMRGGNAHPEISM